MQRPLRGTAYCLAPYEFLHLLPYYSNQNHQSRGGTAHSELGSLISMLNQGNEQASLVGALSQLKFPLSKLL